MEKRECCAINKGVAAVLVTMTLAMGFSGAAMAGCDLGAGGFLAQVVKCVAPPLAPVADAADQLNGQLGNQVDHAAANIANGFVPGSGAALEAGWAIQRSGVLNGIPQIGQGGPFPTPVQFQPAPMGGACLTPTGFHPLSSALPIGFTCSGVNQFGVFEVGSVR